MKYIVATTDNTYFRWQMLIQINNFKKLGILDDLIYVVSIKNRRSVKLNKIERTTGVKIYTYKDERINPKYVSSVRPHILSQHFKKYPEHGEMFFYLDPDVIFNKKPEYSDTIYQSPVWFLSDTKSYIDSKYIKSKSDELFKLMCDEINIDPLLVSSMDKSAGGAQYIIKNVDSDFWKSVEIDSEKLYKLMVNTSKKYSPKHPIQAWTADMWALLWNAWKFNHNTVIDKNLNFSWATDPISKFDKFFIFHNAGVFDQKNLFNKSKYGNKNPFIDDLSFVDKNKCSYKYVQEINDTSKNYQDLIKIL